MKGIVKKLKFKLHGRLNDLVRPKERTSTFYEVNFQDHPSLKDTLESQGIPHPEIGRLTVDGRHALLEESTPDDKCVEIWPSDLVKLARTYWKGNSAFILDVHLGTLARRMRLLGLDTVYSNSFSDAEIINCAEKQQRVVLTRDLGILKNNRVTVGYWLRSDHPDTQLHEILHEFDLAEQMEPLTRCLACNGILEPVAKGEVINKLPERVAQTYNEFYRCNSCSQVFWKGSHYKKLIDYVEQIRQQYLR